MLCWIARTRYVVVSTACNLHGSGAVLLLLPYSSIWNDAEQATCELPLLSLFARGHIISSALESFADWTMFHAAERRQCELPLLPARGAEAMRVATFVRCHSWLIICSFQKCVNAFVPIVHQNTPSNRGGGAVCLPQAPRRNSEVLFLESSAPLP